MNFPQSLKGHEQAILFNNMMTGEIPQGSQKQFAYQGQNGPMFLSPRNMPTYQQNFPVDIQQPLSARSHKGGFEFPDPQKANSGYMGQQMNYPYPSNTQQMGFHPNLSQKMQQTPTPFYPLPNNDMNKQVNMNNYFSQPMKQQNVNYHGGGGQYMNQGFDPHASWGLQNGNQKIVGPMQNPPYQQQYYQQGFQNQQGQFPNKNIPEQYNQFQHSKTQTNFAGPQKMQGNNYLDMSRTNETAYYSEPQNKHNNPEAINPMDMSYMSTKSGSRRKKPIVIMNIDVGAGKKEEIKIFEHDDPAEVANAFCQKFGLPSKVAKVLTQNIQQQVDQFNKLRMEKLSQKSLNNTVSYHHDDRSFYDPGYSHNMSPFNMSMAHPNESYIYPQTARDPRDIAYTQKRNEQKQKKMAYSPFGREQPDEPEDYVVKPMKKSASSKALRTTNHFDEDEDNEVSAQFKKNKAEVYNKLYENGLQHQKSMKKIEEMRKISGDEEELERATFHPKLNQYSQDLGKKRTGKVEDYLYEEAEAKRDRRERAAQLKEKLELEKLTFKPEIDEGSKRIISAKSARDRTPVHERLHDESKLKVKKQEAIKKELEKENTFKPAIDKTSKKIAEKVVTEGNTYERLYKEKLAREKNLAQKREQAKMEEIYDKKTGQKLFQPNITKNKYYEKAAEKSDSTFQEEVIEVEGDVMEATIKNVHNEFHVYEDDEKPKKTLTKSKSVNRIEDKSRNKDTSPMRSKTSKQPEEPKTPTRSNKLEKTPEKLTKSPVLNANKVKDSLKTSTNQSARKKKPVDSNQSSRNDSHNSSMYDKKRVSRDDSTAQSETKRESAESEIERQLLVDIFRLLDGDMDGKISADDVDVSALDSEVLDSIYEVIAALEDNLVLTVNDFVNMVNQKKVINKLRQVYGLPPKEEIEPAKKDSKNSSFVRINIEILC